MCRDDTKSSDGLLFGTALVSLFIDSLFSVNYTWVGSRNSPMMYALLCADI